MATKKAVKKSAPKKVAPAPSQQRGRDMAEQIFETLKAIEADQIVNSAGITGMISQLVAISTRLEDLTSALAKVAEKAPAKSRAKAQPLGPEMTNAAENANLTPAVDKPKQTEAEMLQTGLAGLKTATVAPTAADLRAALTAYATAKGIDEARRVMADSGYASVSSVPVDAIPTVLASLAL